MRRSTIVALLVLELLGFPHSPAIAASSVKAAYVLPDIAAFKANGNLGSYPTIHVSNFNGSGILGGADFVLTGTSCVDDGGQTWVKDAATPTPNCFLRTSAPSYVDGDTTLSANSDQRTATQRATKAYVDGRLAGTAQTAANLSDLTNIPAARTNLGLGNAATKDVGVNAGQVAAADDGRIVGAAQKASNLSDLASPSTARANLGLGGAATENVGTTAGTVAAGDDSRVVGAVQKASNLSDLASVATARANLGLGGAATKDVGTSTGQVAAGDDARIVGAAQKASNLSDLPSAAAARTNLGLGSAATEDVGTSTGQVAAADDSRIVGAAQKASNLSDLASAASARTNLGLGSAATHAASDFSPATTGSAIQKANGAGGLTAATSGTDYAPPSSGSGYQKGNGSGGFTNAATINMSTDMGGTMQAAQEPAHTGDATNAAGSLTMVVPKVNGVSYSSSPATNTVPVVTGANTTTYEAIPAAAMASGAAAGNLGYTPLNPSMNLGEVGNYATARTNLKVEGATGHGDSVYTILANDKAVVTNAAFTAARIWTLPAANAVNAGREIIVADLFGTVTAANTLIVQRAGTDTINGTTSVVINEAYGAIRLVSDGVSKWSAKVTESAASHPATDFVSATTGSAVQKANGAGGLTAATSGTDYAPPSSGSGYQKGNGSGGFTNAATINMSTDMGGTMQAAQEPAHTGDATNAAGSLTMVVPKVNGVSYSSSPATNTVPVVTGANTTTYEAVPNAALANPSITIGGQVTALGGSTSNQGNGAKLQLATGTATTGNVIKYDASGNAIDSGSAIGTSGATIPLNNANNTTSGNNTHSGAESFANIANAQNLIWQRDNPTSSPFQAICGNLVSAEARAGNATLTVTLPAPVANNDCLVELHPFPGDMMVDPNGWYIKTDDFDRVASPLWIPGSNGKPSFKLRYGVSGWGWRTEGLSPPSAKWRYNLSNGQVFFDYDAANARVRLCPLNGGGLLINSMMTYVPTGCVFSPASNFTTPNTTYPVYAYRAQNLVVSSSSGTGCVDPGKLCLTFSGGGLSGFVNGDSITCVNFGLPENTQGTPLGNVFDDPNVVYVDTTHLEIGDVAFVAAEPNYGSAQYPSCAGTVISTKTGSPVFDPINQIMVNSGNAAWTLVGTVTTNAAGQISQVTSQYNGQAPAIMASTPVASLPSLKTGMQLVSNEGGGPAVAFGDGSSYRRIDDGQVVTSTVGSRGLLSRFGVRASTKLQGEIEAVYQQLKENSLLVSSCSAHCLTGLWMFALPDQGNTLPNWTNPGTCDLTVVGNPTFTANQGYTGDGTGALLDTGCSETALGGLQDDFAIGVEVLTGSTSTATVIGQNSASAGSRLRLQSGTSGVLGIRLNSATADAYTPSRYTGMLSMLRDPATTGHVKASIDETSTDVTRGSSSLPASGSLAFLGTNDTAGAEYSTAKIAFAFTGHLTAADLANMRAILEDGFLTQVAARNAAVANLPPPLLFKGQTYFVPDLGGGAGMVQSDGVNWSRTGVDGYETQTLTTGSLTLAYLTNGIYQNFSGTLTGNVTVTLSNVDAKGVTPKKGANFVIRNSGVGAFTFAIVNGGSGGGTLITVPASTAKSARCVFDGVNWQLMQDSAM